MKKLVNGVILLLLSLSTISVATTKVEALSSSQGAVLSTPETNSEFGHVLYFPNSESSKINRYSLNRARKFYSSDLKATWTTLIPQEQEGAQKIEMNSFKMTLSYNGTMATKQDFLNHGIAFHFYITKDGTNFTEMTDLMVPQEGYYQIPGEFVGYRYEMIKTDPTAAIEDTFQVEANCLVDVDLTKITQDQFAGQAGLENWLDSKSPNGQPTSNYQNIFAIQPTISGQVNYQQLAAETDSPVWDSSNAIEGITVDLLEDTPTGERIAASTATDAQGTFTFSALSGKNFSITDTNNQLSVRVRPKSYKGWLVQEGTPTASKNLVVNVGRLSDIARQSGAYALAESKTNWLAPFDEVLEAGKNATNSKFILTDFETTPPTTEPSTTEPSTTEPSTTEPSTTEPSTTEPSTTEPSTTEPSTTEPSTTEPSTTEPGTTEPSTTEPSTTTSTTSKAVGIVTNKNDTNRTGGLGSNNSTNQRKLPATGSQQSFLFIGLGSLVMFIAASLLLFANHKKVD
ncbi:LPXTG cell wall anchor domain-containing protein [Candidatus Enterococcus ferrettii]|uniref:Gram-positive cocci surface proteins LPxTG domain-containing protein n=1 Tax=Candidatus Enterococcus ferrettii TaxID=2815324 RepID=A0ABV0EWB7_9ENTE|nr:LPXTG cell wall anchor domain-containing protein [Enterococcus sp. 665A]MBO1341357.1 LPXTG cell wall anchor domain-containing protein [Enterococcus sp. 665A]